MNRLAGQVALVTGAGRGIGAAIARRFAEEGAKCVTGQVLSPNGGWPHEPVSGG